MRTKPMKTNDMSIAPNQFQNRTRAALPLLARRCLPLTVIALGCFAFSPHAGAECRDGCDTLNFNTFQGLDALNPNTSGEFNTAIGSQALSDNTSGEANTATGSSALISNTTGNDNTASGAFALQSNTTGSSNTATGQDALISNTNGNNNTASGAFALQSNTTGSSNTATGVNALYSSNGANNTANGAFALENNTTGDWNTAIGTLALRGSIDATTNKANSTGSYNTASGYEALLSNSTGYDNVATGFQSLHDNTTGKLNTASGVQALYYNTTGSNNTAMGLQALLNNNGLNNTALGYQAGLNLTTGGNNIVIGAGVLGTAGDASVTRIGKTTQKKTFIGGISGKTVASGVGVIINSSGQLGTVQSSARFKEAIKPMDKSSEAILALKPVTFRYKEELDPEKVPQFGLIAEEVEKVNPDLVVRDDEGKVSTVRYEAVNAMLLNEFLKEHRKVEEQELKIVAQDEKAQKQQAALLQLRALVSEQQKQIEALSAGLQKISDKLELNKPATRLASTQRK
jgi:hypothetical protein